MPVVDPVSLLLGFAAGTFAVAVLAWLLQRGRDERKLAEGSRQREPEVSELVAERRGLEQRLLEAALRHDDAIARERALAAQLSQAVAERARLDERLRQLDEADPVAKALGYVHDTTKADAAKYPTHRPDQICANCQFAQAPQSDGWLPCALFPGKSVSPKGWCVSWAKKA